MLASVLNVRSFENLNISEFFSVVKVLVVITNVQNICNLIGREEYNIGCMHSSVLYSLKEATGGVVKLSRPATLLKRDSSTGIFL